MGKLGAGRKAGGRYVGARSGRQLDGQAGGWVGS